MSNRKAKNWQSLFVLFFYYFYIQLYVCVLPSILICKIFTLILYNRINLSTWQYSSNNIKLLPISSTFFKYYKLVHDPPTLFELVTPQKLAQRKQNCLSLIKIQHVSLIIDVEFLSVFNIPPHAQCLAPDIWTILILVALISGETDPALVPCKTRSYV